MIYIRGQKQDYDDWAKESGSDIWKWENVLENYKKIEDYVKWKEERQDYLTYGRNGPVRVENSRANWEVLNIWRKAAEETLGIPQVSAFNNGDNFGSGYFDVTQKNGRRFSAADAFLYPIANRKNLDILVNHLVSRVIIDEKTKRAQGVEILAKNQERINIISDKEVVLSAGVIHSPLLLQLSGIGPQNLLEKHGIKVIENLPVGENLHDHFQIRPTYKLSGLKTLNTSSVNYVECFKMVLEYLIYRSGPFSMAPSVMGAFGYSNPRVERPNIGWCIQPLSLTKFGDPLDNYNGITTSVYLLRPSSRGSVRITENSLNNPEIVLNYLQSEDDKTIALESFKLTRKIMQSNAFKKFEIEETRPGKKFEKDEDLMEAVKQLGRGGYHLVGSCKMGRKYQKNSVVDAHLKVIGIEGLRVIDSSIMPNITSGNTNAGTFVIAEIGSQIILKENS